MHKKILFLWGIILFFLILPLAGGNENVTSDVNNENLILLKAGPIHTDTFPIVYGEATDEEPAASIASYSVDMANIDDRLECYYIVQFNGPVLEEWKEELAGTGAMLFDYIPNNAFIVRMNPSQKEHIDSFDFVKWTGNYRASYKHQLDITTNKDLPAISSAGPGSELIVVLFDEEESEKIREEIVSLGADIMEYSGTLLRINIPRDMIDELASIEGICWIEEHEVPIVFNDAAAGIINVNQVHINYRLNGTGQIVAVCDTGLDTGVNDNTMHTDIRGRIVEIFDLVGDGAEDQTGHGTHVTGSLLGNGISSSGKYKGMVPEAKLVFQAAADDAGNLTGVLANLSELFRQAYNEGARVHTNSWGYTGDSGNYSLVSSQVDAFMWNHPDMLILFSAGNQGVDTNKNGVVDQNSITPPGTSKNCITVGASENNRSSLTSTTWGSSYGSPIKEDIKANNIEGIAAISSRGPTDDGRIKPDIVAPGTYIASTKSSISNLYSMPGYPEYAYSTGTSMSTPLVAGAAALVRQYYTDNEKLTSPSAALLKATLINGARDMTPGQYGTGNYQEVQRRPDNSQGWGRVDVENSLFPEYPKVIAYYDNKTGIGTSGAWTTKYSYIEAGSPLRATLVWTDYPASLPSSKALVNDLDLKISDSANTYYGNSRPDRVNNVEGVEIKSATGGDYTVTVSGYNIVEPKAQPKQPFALVLSFTCNNNEYPAAGSSTANSTTMISADVVHPGGVNKSSIRMSINGAPVPVSSFVTIDGGYRIQYNAATPYQSGDYNVSITALTAKGQAFSYGWDFNVKPVIKGFSFSKLNPAVPGVINENAKTIALTVPYGTDLKSLVPSIVHNAASVSPASGLAQDFTKPITYIVTSSDGAKQSYVVTVTVAPSSARSITSFRFNGLDPDVVGVVNEASKTIVLTVPYGTNVESLVPTIEHTGSGISPNSGVAQNFTNPVVYTVTAADKTTQKYTVTVVKTAAPSTNANLAALMVSKGTLTPTFSTNAISYNVSVDYRVNSIDVTAVLSDLKASMKMNGQDANSGTAKTIALQPAGSKTTVTVAVTAEDASAKKSYTIVVNRAAAPIGDASYLITVAPVTGGTANVTADKSIAKADEAVNVTIAGIEAGKRFSSISVTGDSGTVQTGTLSPGTSYSFVMPAENVTVGVVLTVEQSTSTPASSSGGGGGGGSTGEKAENIELKDVSSIFVGKDLVRFDFKNPANDVQYVEYTSLKNSGTITATVEVLKGRSFFAGSSPEGVIYRHINIWLGKTGYATGSNIKDPIIVFRVDNDWVSSNNIDPSSIALNRYADNAWNRLPTEQTGSDADYLYFRAITPGFSPFAITGESFPEDTALHSTPDALFSTDSAESGVGIQNSSGDSKTDVGQPEKALPALSFTATLLIFVFACFLLREQ
ncbi:PGF-pre-PGF domain-containing protein [Methanolobus chelungpuianus]|uniref:PGF-pre-PGF domain-containing protein n=1 Tax=Methanolobus chelungpuianus TaxID=502115 RepID=UPI0021140235|nr:PGF-pre-PGF domain-containing protein [Methanolobus chelungpuianus]